MTSSSIHAPMMANSRNVVEGVRRRRAVRPRRPTETAAPAAVRGGATPSLPTGADHGNHTRGYRPGTHASLEPADASAEAPRPPGGFGPRTHGEDGGDDEPPLVCARRAAGARAFPGRGTCGRAAPTRDRSCDVGGTSHASSGGTGIATPLRARSGSECPQVAPASTDRRPPRSPCRPRSRRAGRRRRAGSRACRRCRTAGIRSRPGDAPDCAPDRPSRAQPELRVSWSMLAATIGWSASASPMAATKPGATSSSASTNTIAFGATRAPWLHAYWRARWPDASTIRNDGSASGVGPRHDRRCRRWSRCRRRRPPTAETTPGTQVRRVVGSSTPATFKQGITTDNSAGSGPSPAIDGGPSCCTELIVGRFPWCGRSATVLAEYGNRAASTSRARVDLRRDSRT